MEVNNSKVCAISLGLYPGVLLGFRTYEEEKYNTHVIYMPFIDIAIEIDK